jgi:hypothetical protein
MYHANPCTYEHVHAHQQLKFDFETSLFDPILKFKTIKNHISNSQFKIGKQGIAEYLTQY